MSGKLPGLRRRLAKVEKALAEIAEREKLNDCICIPFGHRCATIAYSNKPEAFEADMNQKCPVHGFRYLGPIVAVKIGKPGEQSNSGKLDELLAEYRERESQYRKAKLEHEHQEP